MGCGASTASPPAAAGAAAAAAVAPTPASEQDARRAALKKQMSEGSFRRRPTELRPQMSQGKVSDGDFFTPLEQRERLQATPEGRRSGSRKMSLDETNLRRSQLGPSPKAGRAHSVHTTFQIHRFCEWVHVEEGARKRGRLAVSSESSLQPMRRGSIMEKPQVRDHHDEYELQFLADALKNNLLFEKLSSYQVAAALGRLVRREVEQGEALCTQGEPDAKHMFVVLDGGFEVHIQKADGAAPVCVARVEPGCCIGEMALLYTSNRSATVRATVPSVVYVLSRSDYQSVLLETPEEADAERVGLLRSLDVLRGVSDARLRALADCLQEGQVAQGQSLLKATPGCDYVLLLTSGQVAFSGVSAEAAPPADAERGGAWRLSQRTAHTCAATLGPGDMIATGRAGDEGLLAVAHELLGRGASQLKLIGLCSTPKACATSTSDVRFLFAPLSEVIGRAGPRPEVLASVDGLRATLTKLPLFRECPAEDLDRLGFAFAPAVYDHLACLLRQGEPVDHLSVLVDGHVNVVRRASDGRERSVVKLVPGDFVGERGMLHGEPAVADAVAEGTVTVLQLPRASFELLPAAAREHLGRRRYASLLNEGAGAATLHDLRLLAVLGAGAYGAVGFVEDTVRGGRYALKMIDRELVVRKKQQKHILSERFAMSDLDHPFITRLFATFKTQRSVYMLLEVSLGGELFTYIKEQHVVSEAAARFYTGCVVLAFEHMHTHSLAYRDLKPENVVIGHNGYVKLVDLGFAKKIHLKTYTLCGTPEYLSPEQITLRGHGCGVDWWAVGVFLYELLVGCTPFCPRGTSPNPGVIYQNILNPKFEVAYAGLGEAAVALVSSLLRSKPMERLGCLSGGALDVRRHAFFVGALDWAQLYAMQLEAPYVPQIRSETDTSKFDPLDLKVDFFAGSPYQAEDASQWDIDF